MKNEVKRVEISESETLPFNSQLVRVKQLDTDQRFGKKKIHSTTESNGICQLETTHVQ